MMLTNRDIIQLLNFAKIHHKSFSRYCQKLLEFNVDFFSLTYISRYGETVSLCTDIALMEAYWQNHCYLDSPYMYDLTELSHFALHSELPHFKTSERFQKIFSHLDLNNRNGAIIIIPEKDYIVFSNYAGNNISNSFIASLANEMERFTKKAICDLAQTIDLGVAKKAIFPSAHQLFNSTPLRPSLQQQSFKASPREFECLDMMLSGKSYTEIAGDFNITERTVANHLQNIRIKNDINTTLQLIELYHYLKYCRQMYS